MQTFPRAEVRPDSEHPLFRLGWLLFFAGIPFLGLSAVGSLVLLGDWIRRAPALIRDATPPAVYRVAIGGLYAVFLLSGITAASRYDAFGTALGYGVVLLFGAAYAYPLARRYPNWYAKYLWVVPISGAVHALWGIYEFALTGSRVMGINVNPNAYGTAMLIALFLGGGALLSYADRRRWLAVPYAALICAAMLFSGSRGSWVGTAAGLMTLGVLVLLSAERETRSVRSFAGPVVLLLTVLLVVSAWVGTHHPTIADRAASIIDLQANYDRVVVYRTVWNMFKAYPLFGVGLNNIKIRYDEFLVDREQPHWDLAHNIVLQYLGETGIVGALFFGLLWFGWLVVGFPRRAPLHVQAMYALLVALFVRDQFDGSLTILSVFTLANWIGATLIARRCAATADVGVRQPALARGSEAHSAARG